MDIAKISSKGQLTVPKEVRKSLGLETGSKVVFMQKGSDWVVFNPDQDPVSQSVQPIDDSRRNRLLQELSARYGAVSNVPDTDPGETSTILKQLQDAFIGVAEDMGWETDQDVAEYIRQLRRDHAE